MSNLIDQRVLIPAPIHAVWSVIADSQQLPKWRVDCQQVSVVTTRQFGVGMRRRCTPPQGKDKLEEISAWYEGLGYEYQVVENRTYKSWVGRIRLQATPDGTIVQWTITYQMAGVIGWLLNMIGGKAQIEEDSANSLRQLHRFIESQRQSSGADWATRRQTIPPVPTPPRASTQPVVIPPTEDSAADTKPRRPAGLSEAIAAQTPPKPEITPAFEPKPPTPLPMPPIVPPKSPIKTTPPVVLAPAEPTPRGETSKVLPPGMPESLKATPPQGIPKVDFSLLRYAEEVGEDLIPPKEPAPVTPTSSRPVPTLPPPTVSGDTGEISIWDVFGVKPPSQQDAEALNELVKSRTGEFNAVMIEPALRDSDTFTFSPLYHPPMLRVRPRTEQGLRTRQPRTQLTKIRFPRTKA